ncbi:MAG: hypothetical protein WCD37_03900 [Chloroflexia bacterium]
MITNLIGTIAQGNEALRGIRRSRFSWHFNTPRRRRWLLVQLVSAPAIPTVEEDLSYPSTHVEHEPPRRGFANPLDEYQFNRLQRTLV